LQSSNINNRFEFYAARFAFFLMGGGLDGR
jgi:hypothetical protein